MFTGETQLDLFYLLCAMAFCLVGGLTPILNRRTNRLLPWAWFGLFAFCRGGFELLSLPMLTMVMPGSLLEVLRYTLLFVSLIFLFEFGRAGSVTDEGPVPSWLLYPALAMIVLFGRITGLVDFYILLFGLSLIGGLWAAWAIFSAADKFPKGHDAVTATAVIMVVYALVSSFGDSSDFFNSTLGVPIQLVRGLVVLALGISLVRLCQMAMDRMMDNRAQKLYQHLTYGTTLGLIFIAAVGLVGALGINYLSNAAAREALTKNQKTAQRLQEVINSEMEKADRLVQLLAGSTRVHNILANSSDMVAVNQANAMLDRYSQTEEGYGVCYIMNPSGVTVGTSNRNQPDSFLGKNYGFRPYFKQGILGLQGRYFALGVTSRDLGYYTSAPVRNDKGAIIGVAVIKRVIRTSGEIRTAFDPDSLSVLVDPHGIVVLSNQTSSVLHSLWPLEPTETKEVVDSKQFGSGPFTPLLEQKPVDGKDYQVAGRHLMASKQPTLMEGWNLYHFGSIQSIPFYRMLGAGAILAFSLALIGFYVSWDANSHKAANEASAELSSDGEFVSQRQVEEELRHGEMKYHTLASNIGLMSEMGDLLQGCNTSEEAVPVITRFMQRLFPKYSGGIYLAVYKGDTYEVAGVWGESPPQESVFSREDCWALRRGRNYVVDDPSTTLVCHHLPEAFPPNYQCWPIMAHGEILGVFHMRQDRKKNNNNAVSKQEKEITRQMVSTVVDQIALILTNLKLREASRPQPS